MFLIKRTADVNKNIHWISRKVMEKNIKCPTSYTSEKCETQGSGALSGRASGSYKILHR